MPAHTDGPTEMWSTGSPSYRGGIRISTWEKKGRLTGCTLPSPTQSCPTSRTAVLEFFSELVTWLEETGHPTRSQPKINRNYVAGTEGQAEGAISY